MLFHIVRIVFEQKLSFYHDALCGIHFVLVFVVVVVAKRNFRTIHVTGQNQVNNNKRETETIGSTSGNGCSLRNNSTLPIRYFCQSKLLANRTMCFSQSFSLTRFGIHYFPYTMIGNLLRFERVAMAGMLLNDCFFKKISQNFENGSTEDLQILRN